jgi:hypothetical protein
LRRLGHAGSPVGTLTPGTIGRVRLEGMLGENAIDSLAVTTAVVNGETPFPDSSPLIVSFSPFGVCRLVGYLADGTRPPNASFGVITRPRPPPDLGPSSDST